MTAAATAKEVSIKFTLHGVPKKKVEVMDSEKVFAMIEQADKAGEQIIFDMSVPEARTFIQWVQRHKKKAVFYRTAAKGLELGLNKFRGKA